MKKACINWRPALCLLYDYTKEATAHAARIDLCLEPTFCEDHLQRASHWDVDEHFWNRLGRNQLYLCDY